MTTYFDRVQSFAGSPVTEPRDLAKRIRKLAAKEDK